VSGPNGRDSESGIDAVESLSAMSTCEVSRIDAVAEAGDRPAVALEAVVVDRAGRVRPESRAPIE
jgi:hypothetical protein